MSDETVTCPWCHTPGRRVDDCFVCDVAQCPVSTYVPSEVPDDV